MKTNYKFLKKFSNLRQSTLLLLNKNEDYFFLLKINDGSDGWKFSKTK